MPGKKVRKSLEELEQEIITLKKELQSKEVLIKAQQIMHDIEGKIASIKGSLAEKELQILASQAERRTLMAELRKNQSLRRTQTRYCNQLQENYRLLELKVNRKIKELEIRFNPSSRVCG